MFQTRNLDFKSSEYWRSMNSLFSCNCTSSQSTSRGEENTLKVGWRQVVGLPGLHYAKCPDISNNIYGIINSLNMYIK